MPEDADSISTFRQPKERQQLDTRTLPSVSGLSPGRKASSAASTGTSITNESYATLDSRISGLASQMKSNQAKTEKQMAKQQEQFDQILASIQQLSQPKTSSSTKDASSPETGNSK